MKSYRALIVGAGGMGRGWGRNLTECDQTEVAGWVDIEPGRAAQAADELKIAGVHADTELERALDAVRPDFVVDVTVPEAHCNVTVTSLGRGYPVIGEKPMAASMDQARSKSVV